MSILEIPAQVWFLVAFGALMVLLADTAVRSWRSPERVADPAFMWPRPAPARSDVPIGPRLPSGRFSTSTAYKVHLMSSAVNATLRPPRVVVVPPAGAAFWSQVEGGAFESCQDGGEALDTEALRESYRTGTYADRVLSDWFAAPPEPGMVREISPRGEPYWSAPELASKHEGATEGWSPLQEAEAVERTALPGDDTEGWWAERLRQFEHRLSVIDSAERTASGRRIEVVRGYGRTVDDELQAFVDRSQQLHAYRLLRIGGTGEYPMVGRARVPARQA